jgi:hypothetical protein
MKITTLKGNEVYCECLEGWSQLIKRTLDLLEAEALEEDMSLYITQIKEKHGFLRIYLDSETDRMSEIIRIAEETSKEICEKCGDPGKFFNINQWLYTRCERCKQEILRSTKTSDDHS